MTTGITRDGISARRVFPFYVVCDVSKSMWDPESVRAPVTPLETIELSLPDMLSALEDNRQARDTAHICIVAFGDSAVEVVPLTSLRSDPTFGSLPRQGQTNYVKVFEWLVENIARYHEHLADAGNQSYTPVVYFLTDGNPFVGQAAQSLSAWKTVKDRLSAASYHPRPVIVALGIGNVTKETVREIASTSPRGAACIASRGGAPGELLSAIIDSIIYSIRDSASSGDFVFSTPDGMERLF